MESEENQLSSTPIDAVLTESLRVLILQHPREAKRSHGTAHLVASHYPQARINRGLAWPNLKKAWEKGASLLPVTKGSGPKPDKTAQAEPALKWGVLYLSGRGDASKMADQDPGIYEFTRDKKVRPLTTKLDGVVILDGNWKEAKTLWWRNAWLLRLTRLVLVEDPATDLRARRSAQKAALTTAECAAACIKYLGKSPEQALKILAAFATQATSVTPAPSPKPDRARPPKSR